MSHQSDLIESDIIAYLKQHERKELLRLLTCGSVDDGKSTLIGRLLHDSKMVYEDQLEAVTRDSAKSGTTGEQPDLSLLVDGLKSEREQGITIDVAYRYFSTSKRKFIIADCPGHEQYTRNMATGASTCDLAVILIDARHGVQVQTRRHSYIVRLLGIKHVVVAINKMDIVDWSEDRFEEIRSEYANFAAKLGLEDVRFLPMSALLGDNVVDPSENMPWYNGPTLMHVLENVHIGGDRNLRDFRFPVQWVNRPNLNFRGFAGQVASGAIRPGESIKVMPSGKSTTIKEVLGPDGPVDEAFTPMSVTLTFDDEIDASRGDTIVHAEASPTITNAFEAMLVWMHEEELSPGREYVIKHGPHRTYGTVDRILHRVDVNSLEEHDATRLELNEIARVAIRTSAPMVLDDYENNRGTGAFVIIDRLTNVTVGAGMIRLTGQTTSAHWETEPGAILAHQGSSVSAEERRTRFGHGAATILLTGLTGSGKTTLALELERLLFERNVHAAVLDGQAMRMGLNRDLGFSAAERSENLRRSMELARMMNSVGTICLAAFVAPEERSREAAKELIGEDRFLLVHLDAPLDVCRARDASGLYERQKSGEHASIPGVTQPYDAPQEPDLRIDTNATSTEDAARQVIALLKDRKLIEG